MSPSRSSERDPALDLLRGGAVLFIAGYHHVQEIWLIRLPGPLSGWLARMALALFCFLSGYLLASRTPINGWKAVRRFYVRRVGKIYPLYFLALAGFVGFGLVDRSLFLPAALLLNVWLDWNVLTLWFVSMIFAFYLVTPLYLWSPSVRKTCGLTGILVVLLGSVREVTHGIDPRIFPNLIAFALGILTTQTSARRSVLIKPTTTVLTLALAGLGALGVCVAGTVPNDTVPTHMTLVVAWFSVGWPWLVVGARRLAAVLPPGVAEFLATASFVLYLDHRLVYRLGEFFWQPTEPVQRQIYYTGILLPVALALSWMIQWAWQRLDRRFSS